MPIVEPTPISSTIEERARGLLAKLTLDEKIAQAQSATGESVGLSWGKSPVRDGYDPAFADWIRRGLGNLHNIGTGLKPSGQAEGFNHLQRIAVEESRYGIPLLCHAESLHGFRTLFPQAIGLGATWDPDLVREVFDAVAREMRACGYHVTYSPVLDLATDPRWGRCQETYGECPYLVSRIGVAAIEGYQGGRKVEIIDAEHVIACAKHFAGYGQSDGGRNFAPVSIGPRRLHDEILAPFRAAVEEAGLLGIMPAHHDIDGVPCHANDHLLRVLLRDTWGFRGLVVSDADDIRRLHFLQGVEPDEIAAGAAGLRHRIAVDILSCRSYRRLDEVMGRYPELEPALDQIVLDLLEAKLRLGLFENPYVDPARADRVCGQPKFVALARRAAEASAVLFKNDNGFFPLDPSGIGALALIGPNTNEIQCGTYGSNLGINLLDGFRDYAAGRFEILHAKGCHLTTNTSVHFIEEDAAEHRPEISEDSPILVDSKTNRPLIEDAVRVASQADVVVLVLGGNSFTAREAFFVENHRGDLDDLQLPGSQLELLHAVAATGKPILLILNHGNAHLLDEVLSEVDAALEIWFAGQETGPAVARLVFGDVAPGGKSPVTFPRRTGSVPCPYNQRRTGRLKEPLFSSSEPVVPFGFGLGTTTWELGSPRLSSGHIAAGEKVLLSVDLTNTGSRAADQVVQVYLHDPVASVTRPERQLIAFRRVRVEPGQTCTVEWELEASAFAFTRADGTFGTEPGEVRLYIGFDSRATEFVGLSCL